MFFWRIFFFYAFKDDSVSAISFLEIVKGFILGFRYDSATIAYILIVPLLLVLFQTVFSTSGFQYFTIQFTRIWMMIFTAVIVLSFISDYHSFIFLHDHINILIFKFFEDDTKALINTISKSYPLALYGFLFIASVYAGFRMIRTLFPNQYRISLPASVWVKRISPLAAFILWGIMARASFGLFPINLGDAAYSTHFLLNKLGPNPLFSLEKAIETKVKSGKKIPFWIQHQFAGDMDSAIALTGETFVHQNVIGDSDEDEFSAIQYHPIGKENNQPKPHVVLGIMEGMGAWVIDHTSNDFQIAGDFIDWIEKGIYFDHFISTGNRSIESLQSILLSIPSIPGDLPLSQSRYGSKLVPSSLANIFNHQGYETHFVYGGKLSWQRLLDFLTNQGFKNLHGDGNFDTDAIRTDWGIYDEVLFDYVFDLLNNADKPHFIVFMTTTNHPPFTIPETYTPLPLTIPDRILDIIQDDMDHVQSRFETYQYGAQKLAGFLEKLYSSDLGRNTLTAITGDHNFGGVRHYSEAEMLNFLRVPLYIKFPNNSKSRPRRNTSFGSHVDIGPTLLHTIGFNEPFTSFGRNLLNKTAPSYMVNEYGFIFTESGVGRFNYLTKEKGFYLWKDDQLNQLIRTDLNHPLYGELITRMTGYYSSASYFLESEWDKE